jgi:hypothetical protein
MVLVWFWIPAYAGMTEWCRKSQVVLGMTKWCKNNKMMQEWQSSGGNHDGIKNRVTHVVIPA